MKFVILRILFFGVFADISSLGRRIHLGPTVDPGVFVLTHVGSCRSGKGYCVLGYNCEVDKDFVNDDLEDINTKKIAETIKKLFPD